MSKDVQKRKDANNTKKDGSLGTILFSSLAIVLLFIVELYLMIAMSELLPAIAVVGIAIVGCSYLDLSTFIKRMQEKELEQTEQYNSMLKSEKASYLLIRKYFDEVGEQLALMEDKVTEPFQEIVAAQKATAKVTINRNKENAAAIMNSNDKLLDIVFGMEDKLDQLAAELSSITSEMSESSKSSNVDLIQKQSEMKMEMNNQIRELELNLKNEILQAVNKLSSVSPQVVMAPTAMPMMQQPIASAPVMSAPVDQTPLGGLGDLPDFTPLDAVDNTQSMASDLGGLDSMDLGTLDMGLDMESEEPVLNQDIVSEPAPIVEPDPEPVVEEIPPMPDMSDPNKMMNPDDIAALLANMGGDAPVAEPEAIPEPDPEPVVEEVPPMPDMSDPNKMMSPDDIAALLANMGGDAPAAELEAIPEPEPEPVVEEKPPMPDMSDPNRSMSPDEIAALFANLG